MISTLVVIGTHKEEAGFGHALKKCMLHNLSDIVYDSPKEEALKSDEPKILFCTNRKSSHHYSNGQTFGSRCRADREIINLVREYRPNITIDVHTTEYYEEIELSAEICIPSRWKEDYSILKMFLENSSDKPISKVLPISSWEYDPLAKRTTCVHSIFDNNPEPEEDIERPCIALEMLIPKNKISKGFSREVELAARAIIEVHLLYCERREDVA